MIQRVITYQAVPRSLGVSSWIDVLQHWAMARPDALAFRFLVDGEDKDVTITFADLDRRARAIASSIQERVKGGDRVLLLYPTGLDFIAAFLGCLYAGAVAVPAYPPETSRLRRALPRLAAIVTDSGARLVLTTSSIHQLTVPALEGLTAFGDAAWLATDTLAEDPEGWRRPSLDEGMLAFLQYTSGSTGAPKGVMVTHGNLLSNSRAIEASFAHDDELVGVGWLPLYHDMGLIGKVLQPLYLGRPCTLLSPLQFLKRPARWLEAISRYGATTSGGPNFAYDLCVRRVPPSERGSLDLSRWRVAFVGAEPVRTPTLERFASEFQACGFRREAFFPCYGLAESTLMVAGGWLDAGADALELARGALQQGRVAPATEASTHPTQVSLSNGRPAADQQVLIVDPDSRLRAPADRVGEIWLAGPSVARGYWNRPDETAITFGAHLSDTGEGPFLRTGDLGFLHEGQLHVCGRIKDLIILRGKNHHPHDIESTVERADAAVRPAGVAAFAVEIDGEEQLVVAAELRRTGDAPADDLARLAAALCQAIADDHEIQPHTVLLLAPGVIPKTSSGKVQRFAMRRAYLADELEPVLKWSRADTDAPSRGGVLDVYKGWNETLEKLERRSTRYRFDLEKDICWDQADAPGAHLGPTWLASYGVDHVALARHPAAYDLFQWAMALSICETFISVEEGILRFLTDRQNNHFASRSLSAFKEEEVKHVALFRRYASHLRRQRPELGARFDEAAAPMVQFHRRVMDNSLRMKESAHHYQAWLYAIFLEEGSIQLHEQLLADQAGLQPTWLSVNAAHRQEEIQHVATDAAYVEALNLDEHERHSLSRLWVRVSMAYFGRLSGLEPAYLLLAERYPEQAKAVQSPLRMPASYFEDFLHARAFARTRAAARYLSTLSHDGEATLRETLALIGDDTPALVSSAAKGSSTDQPPGSPAPALDLTSGGEEAPFLELLRGAPAEVRRDVLVRRIREHAERATGRARGELAQDDAEVHLLKLGIDSLSAVELATRLEADLGLEVPVSAAYDNTIGELSDQLLEHLKPLLADVSLVKLLDPADHARDVDRARASFKRAVALGGRGSAPLFFVGGLLGTVSYLTPLSGELSAARQLVGLQAPGLDGSEAPLSSVQAIARRLLGEVRGLQAKGPYALAGHSFGGLVAYEMARQLAEQGEAVDHLFLLDTSWCAGAAPSDEADDIMAMFEVADIMGRAGTFNVKPVPREALEGLDAERRRLLLAQHLGAKGGLVPGSMLANLVDVYCANFRAMEQFRPAPYAGPVTLLRAKDGLRLGFLHPARRLLMHFDDPSLGFAALCASLRLVSVPGDHVTMVLPVYVHAIAEVIRAELAARENATSSAPAGKAPDRSAQRSIDC